MNKFSSAFAGITIGSSLVYFYQRSQLIQAHESTAKTLELINNRENTINEVSSALKNLEEEVNFIKREYVTKTFLKSSSRLNNNDSNHK